MINSLVFAFLRAARPRFINYSQKNLFAPFTFHLYPFTSDAIITQTRMLKKPSKEKNVPFDISIWKRALIENRHARERRRLQTVDKVLNAIEHLSHSYQWDDLYIFGSVANPERFSEGSDIDVGIGGLDKFLHYRFIADLSRSHRKRS